MSQGHGVVSLGEVAMLRPRTILLANRLLPPICHIGLTRRGCSTAWRMRLRLSWGTRFSSPNGHRASGLAGAGLLSLGSCASTAGHRDDAAMVAALGTGAALSRAGKARKFTPRRRGAWAAVRARSSQGV